MSKRKIIQTMVASFVRALNDILKGTDVQVTFTQDKQTGHLLATVKEK